MKGELVLQFFSRGSWVLPNLWEKVFHIFDGVLNGMPTKLDVNDPLRRNFQDYSVTENAEYICAYSGGEESRTIFGRYPKKKCEFTICMCIDNIGNNSLNIYLQEKEIEAAIELFDALLDILSPFYAFCDLQSNVSAKRRSDFFAVNLQQELVGVFWLTFFSNLHVNHFGQSKFNDLGNIQIKRINIGIQLCLDTTPLTEDPNVRQETEALIDKLAFVDPQSTLHKPDGRHVPTYDRL